MVDLGGGSVQIAYAISDESAANAPPGVDAAYVVDKVVVGAKYHVYTHSFLNYGLKAARAQSLNFSGSYGNPCVTNGYKGTYEYSGVVYDVSPPKSGTSFKRCISVVEKVLKLDAACTHKDCSFDGVWNGGGGGGLNSLYVSSFYYDTGVETGIVEENASKAIVRPIAYRNAAEKACRANVDNIKTIFPLIDKRDVPFLCMDLIYEYTLLVHGFGIDPFQEVTVVRTVDYKGSAIEAAWPLGCAVELLS